MTSEEFDALARHVAQRGKQQRLFCGIDEDFVVFAHRLLAEIEKRAEPVAFCKEGELYWNQPVLGTTKEVGLYTFPFVKD